MSPMWLNLSKKLGNKGLFRCFSLISFLWKNKEQNRSRNARNLSVGRHRIFRRNWIQRQCSLERTAVRGKHETRSLTRGSNHFNELIPSDKILLRSLTRSARPSSECGRPIITSYSLSTRTNAPGLVSAVTCFSSSTRTRNHGLVCVMSFFGSSTGKRTQLCVFFTLLFLFFGQLILIPWLHQSPSLFTFWSFSRRASCRFWPEHPLPPPGRTLAEVTSTWAICASAVNFWK
jgi:hypothetical protein